MDPNSNTAIEVRATYGRTFEPGETIFDEGDPGEHLYVLQSGEVELTREGPGGSRAVAHLGPGDFFGEVSLVAAQSSTARAVAVKRTRLLQLDRETLESMCLAQPQIAIRMVRILVARLVEAERRLALLGADDLMRPVIRTLVRGAAPAGEGTEGFVVDTTLRALAGDAGISMLEAHRAMHQLFDRKLLQLVDDQLRVPDLEALSGALDSNR